MMMKWFLLVVRLKSTSMLSDTFVNITQLQKESCAEGQTGDIKHGLKALEKDITAHTQDPLLETIIRGFYFCYCTLSFLSSIY